MTKEFHDAIINVVEEDGIAGITSYGSDYSGRAMFGETTHAITCQSPLFVGICLGIAIGREQIDPDVLPELRTDQLGLGTVVY